jgi:hypothetical protein
MPLPGLVYWIDAVRPLLPMLFARLGKARADAVCYPQVLVAAGLLLTDEKALFIDCVSAFDNGNLDSDIVDSRGFGYWDYPSRLQQFAAFDEFIATFPIAHSAVREEMLQAHCADFINRVIYAWSQMDAKAVTAFERRMIRNHCAKLIPRDIKSALKACFFGK